MFARRLLPTEAILPGRSTSGCPDLWELADGDFAVIGEDITACADKLPPPAGCARPPPRRSPDRAPNTAPRCVWRD